MKKKAENLELLNRLGCQYIINSVICENMISKTVDADLFIDAVPYPVTIKFTLNEPGYVSSKNPTTITAIETLKKKNKEKIISFYIHKALLLLMELVIFVECFRNIILTVGYQLHYGQFSLPRTLIALVCIGILLGMSRIHLLTKYH